MGKAQTKVVACLALLLASSAFALDPSLDVSQYAHTAWKIREGFTRGTIFSVAQTPDGYLWLGTEFGLYRFDGVRAIPWQPPAGEQLPGNSIQALLVARDQTLWIGTPKGLARWKNGKLTQSPEVAGQAIGPLLEDKEGTIWFGVQEPGRLCALRPGKVQCYGAGSFGNSVIALYEDRKGNLWVSAQTGIWRWAPGSPSHYMFSDRAVQANALIEDESGALLICTAILGGNPSTAMSSIEGLQQLVGGKIRSYVLPQGFGQFRPTRLFRSSDGSLWVGSVQGLLHVHQGRIDRFAASDGLSGDVVRSIFEDREGTIWVSTQDGLDRFRQLAVPTISRNQGLSNSAAYVVQAASDGSIWIVTADGLDHWENGHVTVYGRLKVAGRITQTDQIVTTSARVTEIANSGLAGNARSLGLDDRGRLWASTNNGIFYFQRGRFMPVADMPGGNIFSIAGDTQGKVWISNADQGLFRRTPEGAVQHIPWTWFGQKHAAVALLPDRMQGGIWLGFLDGGIAYLKDGQIRASYSVTDGLGGGSVNNLQLTADGAVWVATDGGLSRVKDGRIATVSSKNGLPCDAVHWAMEDNDHSFWLYMPCGLVRIDRSELNTWVNNPKHVIKTGVFDASDGIRSRATAGRYGPKVTKSPAGKIWFAAMDGVSVIDPQHLPFNKLSPPVHIEQITADGKVYDAANGLRLPPRVRDLAIDYTALSLVDPEKVHFRFKLDVQDKDWREVVNRRRVEYSNLPPGNYRFRVIASNNSGVWNEQGAALDFAIAPAYYQTNWFRGLCVLAFLALVYGAYRLRLRELRQREQKFREAIESIPAMAFTAQPDGSRTFVNRRWVEYTGLPTDHAAGTGWHAVIHPDDLKRVLEKWRGAVASGERMEYEARGRGANGEYRWFLVRAVPVRDQRGSIRQWCGVMLDIEDRKRAEQDRERLRTDLAHMNRMSIMGELSASLSHELKQPIAAAITSANAALRWLQRDQPNVERACETTARIIRDGTRATDIIDRLRTLYKKAPPKRELVDVNELVSELVGLLRGEATLHAVSVRTDLAAEVPKITADRVQIQQVLMNLMLNGIEAMKETGGVLTVKTQLSQDCRLLISVSDTGVGLPAEQAEQIFNAFFTTKPQGSGMGLAISRTIVESHGGRLWASANDGRGATFHFTLPVAAEVAQVPGIGT